MKAIGLDPLPIPDIDIPYSLDKVSLICPDLYSLGKVGPRHPDLYLKSKQGDHRLPDQDSRDKVR
jgi:hypothetical protein